MGADTPFDILFAQGDFQMSRGIEHPAMVMGRTSAPMISEDVCDWDKV
jgi:hypothetical protein